jgi:hypothetical protein
MVFDEDYDEFFSDKAKKKEDCDSYALEHFGGPVRTVSPQGSYRYTAGGGTIVQFRYNPSRLPNMAFSVLISNTHPELVAIPTFNLNIINTNFFISNIGSAIGLQFGQSKDVLNLHQLSRTDKRSFLEVRSKLAFIGPPPSFCYRRGRIVNLATNHWLWLPRLAKDRVSIARKTSLIVSELSLPRTFGAS